MRLVTGDTQRVAQPVDDLAVVLDLLQGELVRLVRRIHEGETQAERPEVLFDDRPRVILVRSWTSIGFFHTVQGVVLPAAVTMAAVLVVATHPQYQGVILTGSAIVFFTVAMILLPRVQVAPATGPQAPAAPAVT